MPTLTSGTLQRGCVLGRRDKLPTCRGADGKRIARAVLDMRFPPTPFAWAVAALIGAATACTPSLGTSKTTADAPAPRPAVPGRVTLPKESLAYVELSPVVQTDGALEVRAPARVEFKDGAVSHVGAPAAGRVVAVKVKTGDRVRAGDPLLTIASPDAAAARNALASARSALRGAQAQADREARMMEEGVGVERERLEADLHLADAKAEVERAEATAAVLGEGPAADVVVRSPITGSIIDLHVTVGAVVQPGGDPLVQVGDPEAVWVVAEVPDHELSAVAEGNVAQVDLGPPFGSISAHVASIGSVVSDALRTAPVRLALDAAPRSLHPGNFGRARIQTRIAAATLPSEAVLIKGGTEAIVYVATSDDTFESRPVVVGRPVDGRVQVLSGLQPGDRVVVRGALLLDGSAEQLL